jgi:hypothetical protein
MRELPRAVWRPRASHLACAQTVLIKLADAMLDKVDRQGAPAPLLSQPIVKAGASAPGARLPNAASHGSEPGSCLNLSIDGPVYFLRDATPMPNRTAALGD